MVNQGQTLNIKAMVPYLSTYDYVLNWEPDADINDSRYLSICLELMQEHPKLGYISPSHQEWVYQRQGNTLHASADKECKKITFQGGFPQLFYRAECWRMLENIVPSCKGPYGGTEYDVWKAVQPWKGLMLRNVFDRVDQSLFDEEYKNWKSATIGRDDQKFFEENS
jgi:hypothetical protein